MTDAAQQKPTLSDAEAPPISVVVIGRNEGERLVQCLQSVRAADYPQDRIELIYVDTASTDGSPERAAPHADRVLRIDPDRPCAAAARNAGWPIARYDLVQFLDGDTLMNSAWLRTAASAIRPDGVACVFGRREEADPTGTILRYWTHLDWRIPPGADQPCGGDVLFRREALREMNGYDESLIAGEEPDLCFRLLRTGRWTTASLDVPMTVHDIGDFRFRQYWRRGVRSGHAFAEVALRHAGSGRGFWVRPNWRILAWFVLLAVAVAASIVWWTSWPIVAWILFVCAQYARYCLRERRQTPNWKLAAWAGLRYIMAKPPQFAGLLLFLSRRITGRGRGRIIEYKSSAREPVARQTPEPSAELRNDLDPVSDRQA